MDNFDFSEVELIDLATHHIGNKLREEELILSDAMTDFDADTSELLLSYFLSSFKPEAYFEFGNAISLEQNEVYVWVKQLFESRTDFVAVSKELASYLYDQSDHPNIKEGAFHLAYFKGMVLGDEMVDAIGIFKSESNVPFLQINGLEGKFEIEHDYGFELKGLDKGCLIFNTDEESGYKILIVDHARKSGDAQYWMDQFLHLRPCVDEYHQTKDFLSRTKTFVTKHLAEEFEMAKTDKIDLLNRSIGYFKENESFDKQEFEETVFKDPEIIDSFRDYNDNLEEEHQVEMRDQFEISPQAVKKQSRIFKSVLKLDRNFHVYIHGNRELIERGTEVDGRKYYKIYYEDEK